MYSKKQLRLFRPAISTASAALVVIALGSGAVANAATGPELSVSNLRTDALVAPIGIADLTPNLSWIDTANVNGAAQSAYQIQAAAGAAALTAGPLLWDSGQVTSSTQSAQYAGTALASRSSIAWQVRVWDATGAVSAWSAPATFQIGLTKQSDWTAQWITNPNWTSTSSASAMPLLAKQFTTNSSIVSAMLYVSGIGIVSPSINGANVGSALLGPGYSNAAAHLAYAEYDVTSMLQSGASNVLGIELGLGNRFVQPQGTAQGNRYVSGGGATTTANGLPRAIAQLEITYAGGATASIVTDGTWQTALGPTTVSAWWGGEAYDARLEIPGWNAPGTTRSSWANAVVTTAPFATTQLSPRAAPPLQIVQQIAGTDMGSPVAGSELYNFGVNAAGWEQFTITAPAGTTLTFTPAEELQNGQAYQDVNTTGVPVFDQFTSNGKTETWSPHLSYHGFQWIQVSGITAGVTITAPTLSVIRAGNAVTGAFQSSDATINSIHNLVDRAVQSNMYSILTDCPSREKGGWDEEVHLLYPMIARHFDIDAYGASLVQNMADAQLSNGLVPDLVPEAIVFSSGFRDDVNWGSAMIQTPWGIYQNYGDTAVLSTYYSNMVDYMNYLQTRVTGNLVVYGSSGLGDWGETSVTSTTTPVDLVENWGYYRDEVAMANIAAVLGKAADAQQYTAEAAATLAAFTATWYNPSTQTVANGTQSSLAMALDIGAVPASGVTAVTQQLVAAVNAHQGFAVGEIGLTPLFRVLAAAGYQSLIYDAVTANQIGGYGYFVAQGLTSLPEYWNITSGSHNHWMLGGVDNWITGNLGGIQQAPGSVNFQNIVIQPAIVRNMTSATYSLQTNHGTIQSSWSNGSGGFSLTATIPVGSTGTINLPTMTATPAGATYVGAIAGSAQYTVGAGTYTFAGANSVATPNTPPLGSVICAVDYGTCTIPASTIATVWYGAGNTWDEVPSLSGSFTCLNTTFGVQDPAPGVQKSCAYLVAPPVNATFCAVDYGTCTLPAGAVATVWYGVNHAWDVFASRTGSFTCLYSTFGVPDPASGVQKSCEYVVTSSSNASQTITFNTIPTQTSYFPVALTATASSGLAVSYASSTTGVCSVSGSSATILSAGTCTITASQAGDSSYAAAAPVSQSFSIAISATAAVPVSLSSVYNASAIANNGSVPYNSGFDGASYAYSTNLLGNAATALGVPFILGAPGVNDAVSNATIPIPAGSFTSLNLLAAAGFGNQAGASFVLTYSDGTTSTFVQGISDWGSPQNYPGETVALNMAYRVTPSGTTQNGPWYVFAYTIPIPAGKTVKSLTLPANRSIVVMAVTMAPLTTAPPVFSPSAGPYATAQTVTLSDSTSGASIFYTTNGTAATSASTPYTGPITVSATETIAAAGVAPGYANSPQVYSAYSIGGTTAAPTFSLPGGAYTTAQTVTLSDTTAGASIYYTINGTTPTKGSTLYAGPITVSASETLSAIAVTAGYNNSAVAVATYSFVPVAGTNTVVNLSSAFNSYAIFNSGTAPTHGGLDGSSYAYAGATLPTSIALAGVTVTLGPVAAPDAVSNKTLTLPAGQYGGISLLASATYGPLLNQQFVVTYTDGTTSTFTQSMSDWGNPQKYAGETSVVSDSYRIIPQGTLQAGPWYIYGYSFALNSAKTVASIKPPATNDVGVYAIVLTPKATTAQTITFAAIANQAVGTTLTLTATATSGAAVTFNSSTTGVCTVSGITASLIAAGTCAITANQAGNSTYAAATPVTQSFSVH